MLIEYFRFTRVPNTDVKVERESMRCTLVFTFVAASVLAANAEANNNFFLPGDAYFPTEITADLLRRLEKEDATGYVFSYSSFDGYAAAFCGYAGYSRAKIPSVDTAFVANLAEAYRQIRKWKNKRLVEVVEDGKTTLTETNAIRVLFYPKAFEFPRFKIGLQYNEKWVEETLKFGHRREYIRLCELVDDKDAVIESWRDSTQVSSFKVLLPDVKLVPVPKTVEPITIEGPVKAIVIAADPLKDYFNTADKYSVGSVRVVDSTGIVLFEFDEGEWKVVPQDE